MAPLKLVEKLAKTFTSKYLWA